jgi:hypothetical protein
LVLCGFSSVTWAKASRQVVNACYQWCTDHNKTIHSQDQCNHQCCVYYKEGDCNLIGGFASPQSLSPGASHSITNTVRFPPFATMAH